MSALPEPTTFLAFGLDALGMVCSPGPNMIYLVSRSGAQGRRAGIVSLLGVAAGFLFYLLLTCLGLAAVFALVPAAYTALKWAGAAYLLWLAWQAKPKCRISKSGAFVPAVAVGDQDHIVAPLLLGNLNQVPACVIEHRRTWSESV